MRLSKEYYSLINASCTPHGLDEHFSPDLLWELIKNGAPLNAAQAGHAHQCRDCRQFIHELSEDARAQGFAVADLLTETVTA